MKGSSQYEKKVNKQSTTPTPKPRAAARGEGIPSPGLNESDLKVKEAIEKEKNIDHEAIIHNFERITNCRFFSSVLAGIIAGTLCLTGLMGAAFYLVNFAVFSIFLFGYVHSQKGEYFPSTISFLTNGMFSHVTVYMIFWVMFYNLVHIY